jgi:hypothetical protein
MTSLPQITSLAGNVACLDTRMDQRTVAENVFFHAFLAYALQALLGSLGVSFPSASMQDRGVANRTWGHPRLQPLTQSELSLKHVIGLY